MKIQLLTIDKDLHYSQGFASDRFYHFFECFSFKKKDRPFYMTTTEFCPPCYRYLKDDFHSWLKSYDVEYSIYPDIEKSGGFFSWNIDIDNDRIALLFKLTWL